MPDNSFKSVARVLRYLYPIAWKRHKGYFFLSAFQVAVDSVRPFVSLMMTPLIIDGLIGGIGGRKLLFYAAVIAVGGNLLSLVSSVIGVIKEKYDEKFQNFFSEELSRRAMALDFQLTEDKKALDQLEAARTGMSWYSGGVHRITQYFAGILTHIFTIAGVAALIVVNAPALLAVIAVVLVINTFLMRRCNQIEIASYKRLSKFNRIFSYLGFEITDFRFGKDFRLYDAAGMMVKKWDVYTKESEGNWEGRAHDELPYKLLITLADVFRQTAFYLYLGIMVILGNISIGVFSQMISAANTLHGALSGLINNVQEIVKRCSYAEEYAKFMEYPAAIEKGERHVPEGEHTIEFRDVVFAYPNTRVRVLDGINLTLHAGEHLSVVGLNGAGKTTFIKLLCRLYDPTEGEILLDGVNIREYDYAEYMELFAPVFQDFQLFAFSIKENIALGDPDCEAEVERLLSQVGLSDKTASLEKGMDTMLYKNFDEDGIDPSGGEKQKIAIARALYKKAPVVILDEPTAALDPLAEYDIYRQFHELVGGRTAVYISHRLSSCKFCDRIAVFSEGRIAEYGTHDELAEREGGIYAGMFAAQAQYYA